MMDAFLAVAGALTPAGAVIAAFIMVMTGKLIPINWVNREQRRYEEALKMERQSNKLLADSIKKLIQQGELSLDILNKLPLAPPDYRDAPKCAKHFEGGEDNVKEKQ